MFRTGGWTSSIAFFAASASTSATAPTTARPPVLAPFAVARCAACGTIFVAHLVGNFLFNWRHLGEFFVDERLFKVFAWRFGLVSTGRVFFTGTGRVSVAGFFFIPAAATTAATAAMFATFFIAGSIKAQSLFCGWRFVA
jgi:hypothetical protein